MDTKEIRFISVLIFIAVIVAIFLAWDCSNKEIELQYKFMDYNLFIKNNINKE
jgi:hypothetical protein